ncbi:MAG TPA: hypothetical protein VH744_10465, partial [Terriglobales bacterium]
WALLVQSGGLVGIGVPTVGVGVGGVPGVSVGAGEAEGFVAASVEGEPSVREISAVASWASVAGEVPVAAGAPPLQADKANTSSTVTVNSFLAILSLLGCDVQRI